MPVPPNRPAHGPLCDRLRRTAGALLCLLVAFQIGCSTALAATPETPDPPHALPAPYVVRLPLVAQTVPYRTQESYELFVPLVVSAADASDRTIGVVPVEGPPPDRPAAVSPDLNLALRGYAPTSEALALVDYGGDTDGDPPQLATLFGPPRLPALVAAYRVFDWNWSCGPDGCVGDPIAWPPVTLLGMRTDFGEPLYLPERRAEIYAGGFVALVLYADAARITLKYGREDTPASGYLVHLEGLAVDPAIVRRYEEMNGAGRVELPGLCNGEVVGWATGSEIKAAVRDTGSFLDPRARKDWWQGWGE